ncbi:MAG TPA: efflux RND transporter periplasmic adaptor subunit [Dongiaceae bacterium]|nr:efflux RND transporter periplasmic adaptor subunit [Dongiaceae bacterium]
MRSYRKQLSVALGALLVAGAVGGGMVTDGFNLIPGNTAQAAKPEAPAATDVDVATVVSQSITDWQSYSGRLEAIEHVEVRPLVPGTIVAVNFKDGGLVKKGDVLFTIDPRPYAAEVDRAAAQVAQAEARLNFTTIDAARSQRLVASAVIATRENDERQSAQREAVATLQAAKAALDQAKINLGFTQVTAPVSGLVSRAELTLGNIVATGANAPVLATLVSVSPIYASFDVDEQTYLRFLRHDAQAPMPVKMGLADEAGYSRDGTIVSVDNHLDVNTGTIRVRARFDNPDGALVPGLYARIQVGGGKPHPAVMVDDAAIGTDQAKKYVLVVDDTDHAEYREVKIGDLQDGLRVVTDGLNPGERIVVNGLQRVRPNDLVKANPVRMADAARVDQPTE